MPKRRTPPTTNKPPPPSRLVVRLDEESKALLEQAAALRRISVGDYVRERTVAQARREVHVAREQTFALSPEEQLAFWRALHETPQLTDAQRLGQVLQGTRERHVALEG